jgi:hypothetical protein
MRNTTLLLALLLLPMAAARAQPEAIPVGARVRVRAPGVIGGRLTGPVVARTADTLTVRHPDATWRAIPISAITSLERSLGRSRRAGLQHGVLRGAAIGLGLGLLNAGFSDRGCDASQPNCPTDLEGISVFTLLGAAIGGGIGVAKGRDRWERVPLH